MIEFVNMLSGTPKKKEEKASEIAEKLNKIFLDTGIDVLDRAFGLMAARSRERLILAMKVFVTRRMHRRRAERNSK